MNNLNNDFIVRHFKRDFLTESELKNEPLKYLYIIENDNVIHSETNERMVFYRSLQDASSYVRPYEMFVSKTDEDKYLGVEQKYRFMPINEQDTFAIVKQLILSMKIIKELNEGLTKLYLSGLSEKQIAFVEQLQDEVQKLGKITEVSKESE